MPNMWGQWEKEKEGKLKMKSDTLRLSSSFEIGTASPMPPQTQMLGKKK
jgi:hypothetical protein